ncbi:MAG TPA: polysaccharide (de)acetylase [Bacteroidales bacterium]|nr:polysaccharide (de)acetylase [Bacteroidales bacterium]
MIHSFLQNLKNIPGWTTSRKIVVFECDDWGSINMPSNEAYMRMASAGLNVGHRRWNRSDTLETAEDLEQLFEVLKSVRDCQNRPAIFTPVTNVANPDFKRIKADGFTKYYYEKFTDTLTRYYPDNNVFKLWMEGLQSGIFMPELHGREHLSVQFWLQELQRGNKDLLAAFDEGFVSLDTPGALPLVRGFRTEFYFVSEDQKPFLINSLREGVSLFNEIFGYLPGVFVPANGIFHPDFVQVLAGTGVKYLWVNHFMRYPSEEGRMKSRWMKAGQSGPLGLTYYMRNCSFEPNGEDYRGVDYTIRQIEAAFRWRKPSIISTHRASYAGGLDPVNRTKGLHELRMLLDAIIKKWPDVEFMSSGDALEYMKNSN